MDGLQEMRKLERITKEDETFQKERISYQIFKNNNKDVFENIKKPTEEQIIYLLYGKEHSGKTTVLRNLYIDCHIEKSEFIDGKNIFVLREFFYRIGIEIKEGEDYKSAARVCFMNFGKILFIDDFDKMLANLGEDFAAYLRAIIQEFRIKIISTATLGSNEFNKYFLRYDTPFYRFFLFKPIEYQNKDIKETGIIFQKEIKEKDIDLIRENANDNIKAIISVIKNYNGNISVAIQNAIIKNGSICADLIHDLTPQQKAILDYMSKYIIQKEKENEGVKLNDIAKYLFQSGDVLRTQINRIIKNGLIKKLKKEKTFLPNIFLLEEKKIEESKSHLMRGIDIQNDKKYEEAEKEFREAIRINPNYPEAHNVLGVLLTNLKRYEKAEKEYREAIRTNPNYAYAHNNLGVLLKDLKRFDEAEKEYREAIKINQNYTVAHYNLGLLLSDLKRYEEAEKEYREAIRTNPNHAEAHRHLRILYKKLM